MHVPFWTLLLKYFLLLKIGAIYVIILSKNVKNTFAVHVVKNIKKNFLQLRFSNVLLKLKPKVLLSEPKTEFNNLAGAKKALAVDHHEEM